MKAEEYTRREQELSGWSIVVETYRSGDTYYCTMSSVDPGARFARAGVPRAKRPSASPSRRPERWLGQTRRFSTSG